jgi:NMD protein affecting ribosome stability and mRNA decay
LDLVKTAICQNCHTEFQARDKRQKLCKSCKYEAHKKVMREYWSTTGYKRPVTQYIGTSKRAGMNICPSCGKHTHNYFNCPDCLARKSGGIDEAYGVAI